VSAAEPPVAARELAALFSDFPDFSRVLLAVSGGPDSTALLLLAARWRASRANGPALIAATVDHGLRREAKDEAAAVARLAKKLNVPHRILAWRGKKPKTGVQAAARTARYVRLEAWCARAGVLHLLLAHHREDQAETLLLRLARGSGLDGLAGMAAVAERASCRRLRPLLAVPRARLEATLRAAGRVWIEDPSNRDPAYLRVRLRQAEAVLAAAGLDSARLAETAARLGRARAALEAGVATLLARTALVHPAGFVRLDPAALMAAPEEIGLRALAAVLALVGGASYTPRLERLERLYRALPGGIGAGRTLGGCRILPQRGRLLVCREPAAVAPPVAALPGGAVHWDGRFCLYLPTTAPPGLSLGALGAARLAVLPAWPAAARAGLPALSDGRGVLAVPALGYVREGAEGGWLAAARLFFRPSRPLSGSGFTVV
jgi:tRNA(Ile)-lysidine synthase